MEKNELAYLKLRQHAEAQLERRPLSLAQFDPDGQLLHELLHELRVHRIELEMQNEALRQSQVELEKSRDRYVELYDFAPVGYITLNHEGMIDEINLTAAALLKIERSKLSKRRFASFIAPPDRDRWYRHFLSVLKSGNMKSCELLIQNKDESSLCAILYCQRLTNDGKGSVVRIALADITESKRSQAVALQVQHPSDPIPPGSKEPQLAKNI